MGIGYIPDPRPHLMRAGLRLVALIIVACVVGAMTCGCREPANCNRGADTWRCSPSGRPERCSEGNVWRSQFYGPCPLSGGRCVVVPGVGATCVRADHDAVFPTDATAED